MKPRSLIETIRIRNGEAPLWGLHLARLVESCTAVGVPVPLVLPTPFGGADRVHRLVVSQRGVETSERAVGSLEPITLITSTVLHHEYRYKLSAREPFDRAGREAERAGADDAILLVPGGWVAETAIWGLYWWDGDRLAGPPLDFGILRSVARRRIEEVNGPLAAVRADPADLAERGLFVANAARGVVRVASLDGRSVAPRPETERVARLFWP